MMSSILEEIDVYFNFTGRFWNKPCESDMDHIDENLIHEGELKILNKFGILKSRRVAITNTSMYLYKNKRQPKYITHLSWKLFEGFIETANNNDFFGFRLGYSAQYQDFYAENRIELDEWLTILSKLAISNSFDADYVLIKEIGQGSFAKVFLASDAITKQLVAVKIINKSNLQNASKLKEFIKREIIIHRKLNHPNIVKLFRVYETSESINLVMEYVNGSDLLKKIQKNKFLEESLAASYIIQILQALNYLHENGIIHRDMKPENILIKLDDSIKISDFGLSCFLSDKDHQACGSPGYMAPEIFGKADITTKADMFAVGIILYIMLSGSAPFYASRVSQILMKSKLVDLRFTESRWKFITKKAIELIIRLTNKDHNLRLSADKAMEHPWCIRALNYKTFLSQTPQTDIRVCQTSG